MTTDLSPRELQVLTLIGQGLSDRQTAEHLNVAVGTIHSHTGRIRAKYAAAGRPAPTRDDLWDRALEDGLIDQLPTHRPLT